ncbi:hypothetical protein FHT02_004165 [Sphingomonas xinjiangensis]|uniref:Uncharacterized protein n=1 Tax=Sphingomonas xinjiangensis TaxID=643568 RepID=A0A840YTF3_9SPHN|nr:hypothetical protein [Sphingomonas xinjiangensis]
MGLSDADIRFLYGTAFGGLNALFGVPLDGWRTIGTASG